MVTVSLARPPGFAKVRADPPDLTMPSFADLGRAPILALLALACLVATAAAIPLLMPLLRRYALARPNARSSHKAPTPQGGGIPLVGAVLIALALVAVAVPDLPPAERISLLALVAASLALAILGGVDDIRPLPALPRLLVQAACVVAVVATLPPGLRLLPAVVPAWLEQALVVVALLWFVNLTNFMDGLDWITVAGFAPLAAALVLMAVLGAAGPVVGVVGATLLGGLLGFAPFNRPVARLFLGDVGSLPIGLLAGYALVRLGGQGHLAAALILPLYYLADATLTLLRRLAAGERVWDAHRSHYYQRATTRGLSVPAVVARVAAGDAALAGLALLAVLGASPLAVAGAMLAALAVVALLLRALVPPAAS